MSITLTQSIRKVASLHQRNLFQWINIIFNKVDEDRRKLVGPDRTCAEWLLRNGAYVKWVGDEEYLTDYNKLPDESVPWHIQEVDATDSSIMHYGFEHFKGCQHIRKLILHKCSYLEDKALEELVYLRHSLLYLQVSSCHNITGNGLRHLNSLNCLQHLLMSDLPYVKDKEGILGELRRGLPKCEIKYT